MARIKQSDINPMTVEEFRSLGLLQELNRQFLHPLGLALSIRIDKETGKEYLDSIWDYRNDPEGVLYDVSVIDAEFTARAKIVEKIQRKKAKKRLKLLGYVIQPAKKPEEKEDA